MTEPVNPSEDIKHVIAAISDVQKRIDQGERIDLSGLVQKIENVCERLAAMPDGQGRGHAKSLTQILKSLDGLENSLKSTLEELNKRLTILAENDENTKA